MLGDPGRREAWIQSPPTDWRIGARLGFRKAEKGVKRRGGWAEVGLQGAAGGGGGSTGRGRWRSYWHRKAGDHGGGGTLGPGVAFCTLARGIRPLLSARPPCWLPPGKAPPRNSPSPNPSSAVAIFPPASPSSLSSSCWTASSHGMIAKRCSTDAE